MTKAIAIAASWGLVIAVLPLEIFLLGIVVWLPLAVLTIWRLGRGRRLFGFGACVLMVAAAIAHPNSYDHHRFGPFPKKQATLRELAAVRAVFVAPGHEEDLIRLPSENPTKLEIRAAITNQTHLQTFLIHCGNGSTLYSGGVSGPISVREKTE